ncbi:hypothetical protein FUAX_46890 (plasmid) [Fulvitalea axinellae]|uniref:DinB-like domain-containing protein n=1 Tax=Fulvitalea axinellae TaxID=1182444 RepID=A0AAU9CZ79_9BACT|nr:hypothetical protein FUAX_46890 [Fulvitalea axinellae]
MNTIEMLRDQTASAYAWTNRLLEAIPFEHWETMHENTDTHATWQVGHLVLSHYFHSIMCINGHSQSILQAVPLQKHNELFVNTSPKESVGKTNPEKLLKDLKLVQAHSVDIIKRMNVEDLSKPLEPTETPNPVAKTKYEALDWNIKHTMWHCGQLGIIKRQINGRHDFGLKRKAKAM